MPLRPRLAAFPEGEADEATAEEPAEHGAEWERGFEQ